MGRNWQHGVGDHLWSFASTENWSKRSLGEWMPFCSSGLMLLALAGRCLGHSGPSRAVVCGFFFFMGKCKAITNAKFSAGVERLA